MLLADVLIIDATDRLGWLAGRILADLGADVIKIEQRGSDRGRSEWRAFNVNKRVLEFDATQAADRERIESLLGAADICLLTPGLPPPLWGRAGGGGGCATQVPPLTTPTPNPSPQGGGERTDVATPLDPAALRTKYPRLVVVT